jgi:formylmethanofuran dehydrogenase subunit E
VLSHDYAPAARNKWEVLLIAYQVMPASELFIAQPKRLDLPLSKIMSQPGAQGFCEMC